MIGEHEPLPLTKILATLGPASGDDESITRLVEAGARMFRLNFSHGDADDHLALLEAVRAVEERIGEPLAVLGDLPGPKIRLGDVVGDRIELKRGEDLRFVRGDAPSIRDHDGVRLTTNHDELIADLRPGERILIDDGAIRLLVTDIDEGAARCTVLVGGPITRAKGVNLPDTNLTTPAIGPRDLAFVEWSVRNEIDLLALSFVRSADEIESLRRHIRDAATKAGRPRMRLPIVAKIERPEAVERAEAILEAADGVMVARGDLGVEMDLWRVPIIQHQLLELAGELGCPCIIATQMLQSMIEAPTPTRAEANDIAVAIMEGTDAVMLSGETAVGQYPPLAVEAMRRIATHTEGYIAERRRTGASTPRVRERFYRTAALSHGVWQIARDNKVRCLAVWSQEGGGARYLSQNDFDVPIIACSNDRRALRRMRLLRAVVPVAMEIPESLSDWTDRIDELLRRDGFAESGDRVVLMAGAPLGVSGVTNCIALHEIGNRHTGFR